MSRNKDVINSLDIAKKAKDNIDAKPRSDTTDPYQ